MQEFEGTERLEPRAAAIGVPQLHYATELKEQIESHHLSNVGAELVAECQALILPARVEGCQALRCAASGPPHIQHPLSHRRANFHRFKYFM